MIAELVSENDAWASKVRSLKYDFQNATKEAATSLTEQAVN